MCARRFVWSTIEAKGRSVLKGIKRLLCCAICALVWNPAFGQTSDSESRTYAVLSLIGDKINIVGHQATTGSKIDRNRQVSLAVDHRALDNTAVLAAINAIKRLDARAATVGLTSSNATLYELQSELFEAQGRSAALLADIKELLQSQNATHLVLITKHRGDALLRLENSYTGSGKIEGIGFYMDADLRTKRTDTYASGPGFLAPFAYIKITLVDAKTMVVIREQTVEETTTLSTARAEGSLNPADVLTAAQKAAALQAMIRKAIARAMPDVLRTK
jgi:hypothetical protein